MSNCFHLAIEGGDLSKTIPFYTDIMMCKLGPSQKGKWQDIDFWGNELTLHHSVHRNFKSSERILHNVDMGAVCVPHFGIHLTGWAYSTIKERVMDLACFYDPPYIRFEGKNTQQETFFVEDPNYNMLENPGINEIENPVITWGLFKA